MITVFNERKDQRFMRCVRKSAALALALLFFVNILLLGIENIDWLTANAATSGTCGENLTWELSDDGVLTISGTGSMYDWYSEESTPWYNNGYAFYSVVIGDGVTSIGNNAFFGRYLKNVTIGNSVTSIGGSAFSNCRSLTSVTIPDGVTAIGDYAFSHSGLTSVTIPDSVTSIDKSVFAYCSSLTNIMVDPNSTVYKSIDGVLYNKAESTLILCPPGKKTIDIPASVTTIGAGAFANREGLTSVTIHDSVTSIGDCAFQNCDSLTSIEIPDSVTSIGAGAFGSCGALSGIDIPESVTFIGEAAFANCWSLTSVTIPDGVTFIGESTFAYCYSLTEVNLPDSVTSIGQSAFEDCVDLERIIIPDSVTSIGHFAFRGCTSLTSITIPPKVTSVGNYAFSNCELLSHVTIADGATTIGRGMFSSCPALTSITIPDSVTHIYNEAFKNCDSLESITLPDSITYLNEDAFQSCDSLTSITVNENNPFYKSIDGIVYALYRTLDGIIYDENTLQLIICPTAKTTITIPNNVTSIGVSAFAYCPSLTDVYYAGTESEWNNISVESDNDSLLNATIHFSSSPAPDPEPEPEPEPDDGIFFSILCDNPLLCAVVGETINIGVKISVAGSYRDDVSGLTFLALTNNISLSESTTSNSTNYISVTAKAAGEASILVTDPITNTGTTISITITTPAQYTYTVETVPHFTADGFDCSVYNYNSMYLDNYRFVDNRDGSYTVNFDVYNGSSMYGVVEVYNKKGELTDCRAVAPGTALPTNLIETGDMILALGKDIMSGELNTYRQESMYSQKTIVRDLNVPEGGYINFTSSTDKSAICKIINCCYLALELADFCNTMNDCDADIKRGILDDIINEIKLDYISDSGEKILYYTFSDVSCDFIADIAPNANSFAAFGDGLCKVLDKMNVSEILIDAAIKHGVDMTDEIMKEGINALIGSNFITATLELGFAYMDACSLVGTCIRVNRARNNTGVVIQSPYGSGRSMGPVLVECNEPLADDVLIRVIDQKAEYEVERAAALAELNQQLEDILERHNTTDWRRSNIFDITLIENGVEVQPSAPVNVSLRIPGNLKPYSNSLHVYRVESNQMLTDMHATVSENYLNFSTDHFSEYIILPSGTTSDEIMLTESSLTLAAGVCKYLELSDDSNDLFLEWSSANKEVATVSKNGLITAVAPGQTTITVTNGIYSASCIIYVAQTLDISVSFSGKLLNGICANAIFTAADGKDSTYPITRNTLSGGKISIGILNGTYNLTISKPGHTSYIHRGFTIPSDVLPDNIILYPGDITGDGRILAQDQAAMTEVFGLSSDDSAYITNADFNEDGYINAKDRADIIANFGKTDTVVE